MAATFSPREKAQNVISFWWIVACIAILGGLIGMVISAVRKPVYEARVTLTMGINFARTGILEQYDKDLALGTAAGIIYSTDVIQRVAEAAQQQNIPADYDYLINNSTIERKAWQWTLRVRAGDPEQAAFLANQWIEYGIQALTEAYKHALVASSLQDIVDSLEYCLQQVAVNAVVPVCPYNSLDKLQAEFSAASDQLITEKQAARNLFPEMTFSVDQLAVPPDTPVLYGRNTLVLVGLLAGLLLGIAVVSTGLPERLSRRK